MYYYFSEFINIKFILRNILRRFVHLTDDGAPLRGTPSGAGWHELLIAALRSTAPWS